MELNPSAFALITFHESTKKAALFCGISIDGKRSAFQIVFVILCSSQIIFALYYIYTQC